MAEITEEEINQLLLELESLKREPQRISTYRTILAKKEFLTKQTLGSGSYSKVKFAYNLNNLNNVSKVAIKIVDRTIAPKSFQNKFLPREIAVWPRLKHENIINLIELFEDSRWTYMVLEYGEQGDMLRHVQENGAVSEDRALQWFRQITSAVKYLHDRNIAHRDLKLENLMLDKKFNVKIGDFGFVKEEVNMDVSATFCGSRSYAAPEILMGVPYQPMKADIWAMGVVLYIIVTGRMPFDESKGCRKIIEEQTRLKFPRRKVSTVCRAFLFFLFTYDFTERPDIYDVINHPCLRDNFYQDYQPVAQIQRFDSRVTL